MSKQKKNHIAIVLDRSGSMHSIRTPTVQAFNAMVAEIRRRSAEEKQDTSVSFITFANKARLEFFNADAKRLKTLTYDAYLPDGNTALFDGVKLAVDSLNGLPDADDENTSFLVLVVTDGEENFSECSHTTIKKLMRDTQKTDRWSFAFQLPPGFAHSFCSRFDIPSDNVREWEATAKGVKEAAESTQIGLMGFFKARSAGQKSVKSFYVTTDLAGVKPKDVKAKLDDISDRFKVFTVEREMSVKEFVEGKTGKPYLAGSTYYQLSKSEKVQKTKSVLITEKGKKAIWGGPEARDLIGLPQGAEARVNPGNHSTYDIYIESRSHNRVLVRGTKVMVDVTIRVGKTPTWVAPTA